MATEADLLLSFIDDLERLERQLRSLAVRNEAVVAETRTRIDEMFNRRREDQER
jgi:hypothetical protein